MTLNNYLPNEWKTALVTMIPKNNQDKSNPRSYRPISVTFSLMRWFEKLIANRLKKFLKDNNILIKQQSGFRAKRQTKDNLIFITQKVSETFNRKKKCCAIFFLYSFSF